MDFSMISWPQIGVGSGWLFVGLFVWALLTGRVIPRSTHDDALHDRNEWRAEGRVKDQQIAEKDKQLTYMAEVGRLLEAVLTALKRAERISREEEESS